MSTHRNLWLIQVHTCQREGKSAPVWEEQHEMLGHSEEMQLSALTGLVLVLKSVLRRKKVSVEREDLAEPPKVTCGS